MYDADTYSLMRYQRELDRAGVPREFIELAKYEGLTCAELSSLVRIAINKYRRDNSDVVRDDRAGAHAVRDA